jgi:hypothetical protein
VSAAWPQSQKGFAGATRFVQWVLCHPKLRLDQLANVQEEVTALLHKSTGAEPVNGSGPGV